MAKEVQYFVTWEMDIWARSPKEAAKKALRVHRNPESTATVFKVASSKRVTTVDLGDSE